MSTQQQPPYYPPYYPQPEPEEEDSIDLLALAKKIWAGRKTILIGALIGTVLGIATALLTTKQYTVSTVMVPQVASKSSAGGLSSLAALAGIDLGSAMSTGEISPLIYPQIVSSTPFQLELMQSKFHFQEVSQPVSLFDYYTHYKKKSVLSSIRKYTIGLPGVLKKAITGDKKDTLAVSGMDKSLLRLNEEQAEIAKLLEKIIGVEVDAKQGYLTLTVTMNEPLVAAELAQKAQDILQREIIRFKVQKAQADLDFIQGRYDELKARAEGYQVGIAQKSDQYKNLVSSVPQVQSTRLQTQYGIASTVFTEVAKQLEQAKIQVKRDTPTFTIIQPVVLPNLPSGTSRAVYVVVFLLLGGIVGTGIVLAKGVLQNLKAKWREKEEEIEN